MIPGKGRERGRRYGDGIGGVSSILLILKILVFLEWMLLGVYVVGGKMLELAIVARSAKSWSCSSSSSAVGWRGPWLVWKLRCDISTLSSCNRFLMLRTSSGDPIIPESELANEAGLDLVISNIVFPLDRNGWPRDKDKDKWES
jgi:hypothetical protein